MLQSITYVVAPLAALAAGLLGLIAGLMSRDDDLVPLRAIVIFFACLFAVVALVIA